MLPNPTTIIEVRCILRVQVPAGPGARNRALSLVRNSKVSIGDITTEVLLWPRSTHNKIHHALPESPVR